MILLLVLFACVGVAFEIVFTALMDFPKTRSLRLKGYSYIWMFPLYALIPVFLCFLWPHVGPWPIAARLGFYVVLLYIVEYATGWILRWTTGQCPWDYGNHRFAVQGVIRLDYAPAWALAVFLFEYLYLALLPLAG